MEQTLRLMLVEDDPVYGHMMEHLLQRDPAHSLQRYKTGEAALAALASFRPHVLLTDFKLPDIQGDKLLERVRQQLADLPVIVLSGQQDVKVAVSLLQQGAYDYIVKDEQAGDRLLALIERIREQNRLTEELEQLRREVSRSYAAGHSIIGNSPAMQQVFLSIEKAAQTDINVSIFGETGTGKEVVGKAIHYQSARSKAPFVAVNVAAIPEELIESELFGHEKGAFTGATARRKGKFEEAGAGTILLDEVGEMPATMQVKLLRVLQERELVRLGGNERVPIRARLMVATHRNLRELVQQGSFREDLYYRLQGYSIELPPLRERGKDTLLLAQSFASDFCERNGLARKTFSAAAQRRLLSYGFPGNVRELRSVIELACAMSSQDEIDAPDLQLTAPQDERILLGEELTLREYNHRIVAHFLEKYDGNVLEVARRLQVGKSTLYRMLKEVPALKELVQTR
jgi:DNA-binding NtrC family response regulator